MITDFILKTFFAKSSSFLKLFNRACQAQNIFKTSNLDTQPIKKARKDFYKQIREQKKSFNLKSDTAMLSSSWCYKGTWTPEGSTLGKQ